MVVEREYTEPVDECDARGRLNPAARGWSRHPLLRANLHGRPGRKKRWDYWNVNSPDVVVGMVYADVDYAGLANVWVMEHASAREATAGVLVPFARGFRMPERVCTGSVLHETKGFRLSIDETDDATRLRASGRAKGGDAIDVDVSVAKPAGHESLNVMIPWSERLFQFTSKGNTRPATGHVRIGDTTWQIGDDAWGTQDLGRGIWPYSNRWNWASASGHNAEGRLVGLQFGGKWTVGTGATENALCLDGRLTKVSEELEWTYDWDNPMAPWRALTAGTAPDAPGYVDATLTPTFDRYDVTDLKVLRMEVHQCFGTWAGRVVGDDGVSVEFEGIRGFAEEARNKW